MATASRPPVNEVVLAVSFGRQAGLEGPQLVFALDPLRGQFRNIVEQPPYEMPVELPLIEQLSQPMKIELGIGLVPPGADRRYWLTAPTDDALLVQVQPTYFALNWRDRGGSAYPGFDHLRTEFERTLSMFQAGVTARGGDTLSIRNIEVTYVNILRPGKVWAVHSDLSSVISVSSDAFMAPEQLNLGFARAIERDETFIGRVHTAVQTGYQTVPVEPIKGDVVTPQLVPVINLSITARSTRQKDPRDFSFFAIAHEEATRSFRTITTSAAQREWGLL